MSKTEDYLDGLLNAVEGKNQNIVEPELPTEEMGMVDNLSFADAVEEQETFAASNRDADSDFLDSFERDFLSGEDEDEFIRQFERELAEEDGRFMSEADLGLELDDNFAEDSVEASEEAPFESSFESLFEESNDLDFMVDTIGEIPEENTDIPQEESMGMEEFSFSGDFDEPLPGLEDISASDDEASDSMMDDDQDLMALLQSDGDFSDIGDTLGSVDDGGLFSGDLAGDFAGFTLEEVPIDDTMILEEMPQTEVTDKKVKSEASGFLNKISKVLFGEDEDELAPTETPVEEKPAPAPSLDMGDLGDMSDEDLLLLQQLEGGGMEAPAEEPQEVPETEEEAKARKKREKAEKKAQKKAEKAEKKAQKKAEKAAKKAQKEKDKKPKKPKEPDNSPPLPKKPVILIFVMVASFLVLVILGTNLFGYSSHMQNAERQFGLGNYEEAYQQVSGMEIKEQDVATYEKYRVMGNVAGEYSAYQTFMEAGMYDMALDSLVRAVGRCEKYQPEAELYGCTGELARIREQAYGALGSFGITADRALELYAIEERSDYSVQINTILEEAGYTVVD